MLSILALGAIFTAVAFHVVIAQGQLTLDRLERRTEAAEQRYRSARYAYDRLAAPDQVLTRAAELGLVAPEDPPVVVAATGPLPEAATQRSTLAGWKDVKPSLVAQP
jgi:hypothetical protein